MPTHYERTSGALEGDLQLNFYVAHGWFVLVQHTLYAVTLWS